MNGVVGDESNAPLSRLRPGAAATLPAEKPGGSRLLSFILRVVVMVVALSLFFLFAGIAVFVLILLFIIGRVLRRRQIFRAVILPPEVERRGVSQEEMRLLPCFRYSGVIPAECVVCLEGIREGEWCRVLSGCNHVFHRVCVDRWLERSRSCPICRGGAAVGEDEADALEMPLEWI